MSVQRIFIFLLVIFSISTIQAQNQVRPLADGKVKFLGNVHSWAQMTDWLNYWNQVTPENAGKWGSVESKRDSMNWRGADAAYKFAKDNNLPFKWHVMVWGNQQPSWIEDLPPMEQREEIEEWFQAVSGRYPGIDFIEIVNEPVHDPPNKPGRGGGNYIAALGGNGETGWDWIIESFRLGRQYFPNAKLVLNDYSIINSDSSTAVYLDIVNLLKAQDLIDHLGFQAHAFSLKGPTEQMLNNINKLADTGLPLFITELDIDSNTDEQHLEEYKRLFPIFWEHPAIQGITLWGFRAGQWRTRQGANLVNRDSTSRPSFQWLQEYVRNNKVIPVESLSLGSQTNVKSIETKGGSLQMIVNFMPKNASLQRVTWSVSDKSIASISASGLLTAKRNGNVMVTATSNDGRGATDKFKIKIKNQ